MASTWTASTLGSAAIRLALSAGRYSSSTSVRSAAADYRGRRWKIGFFRVWSKRKEGEGIRWGWVAKIYCFIFFLYYSIL
ncbi:unnamed protein product [Linum tenue]|uniref:Uncharacterized protein n=1 Tax=Linum tenue TaxID=586396 RepID=A0AAV0LBB1_9ROSI|nr:unnamed protein product [Linum tenue]